MERLIESILLVPSCCEIFISVCLILLQLGIYSVCVCVCVCGCASACAFVQFLLRVVKIAFLFVYCGIVFFAPLALSPVCHQCCLQGVVLLCDLPHRFIFSPYLFTSRFLSARVCCIAPHAIYILEEKKKKSAASKKDFQNNSRPNIVELVVIVFESQMIQTKIWLHSMILKSNYS